MVAHVLFGLTGAATVIPLDAAAPWHGGLGAVLGAVLASVVSALIWIAVGEVVKARWPRLHHWWSARGGLLFRHSVLLVFFSACAVAFGLASAGLFNGGQVQPVALVLAVPAAAMAVWSLVNVLRLRAPGSVRRGYRRSSDGSWSSG